MSVTASEVPSNAGNPLAPTVDTNENTVGINKSSRLPVRKSAPADAEGGNKEQIMCAPPPSANATKTQLVSRVAGLGAAPKFEGVLPVPSQALKDGDGTMSHHESSQKEVIKCNALPLTGALKRKTGSAKVTNVVSSAKSAVRAEENVSELKRTQSRKVKIDLVASAAPIKETLATEASTVPIRETLAKEATTVLPLQILAGSSGGTSTVSHNEVPFLKRENESDPNGKRSGGGLQSAGAEKHTLDSTTGKKSNENSERVKS